MAKAFKIADFFAKIGVKGDIKELNNFITRVKVLDKTLKNVKKTTRASLKLNTDARGIVNARARVDQLNRSLREAKRNARINIRTSTSGVGGGGTGAAGGSLAPTAFGAGLGAGGFARSIVPGLGLGFGIKNLVQTEQAVTGIENALTAASGSVQDGRQQMKFLREETDRLGINFLNSARGFTNMLASGRAVGINMDTTREIFLGVAESARVLNLSADDTDGVLRAITQMMSKGTIQSEELKGQLGERLPGAIGIFANSMGVSTEQLFDMLERGEVLAKDTLPNFARELRKTARIGGALDDAIESNAAQMQRMFNAFTDIRVAFARGGFQDVMSEVFRDAAKVMEGSVEVARMLGKAFKAAFRPVKALFIILSEIMVAVKEAPLFFQLAAGGVLLLSAAFTTLGKSVLKALAPLLAIGAVLLGIEDVMRALQGKSSFLQKLQARDDFIGDAATGTLAAGLSAKSIAGALGEASAKFVAPFQIEGSGQPGDSSFAGFARNFAEARDRIFQEGAPAVFNVEIDASNSGDPEEVGRIVGEVMDEKFREAKQSIVEGE
jgi:tape measure domain-containing protein